MFQSQSGAIRGLEAKADDPTLMMFQSQSGAIRGRHEFDAEAGAQGGFQSQSGAIRGRLAVAAIDAIH